MVHKNQISDKININKQELNDYFTERYNYFKQKQKINGIKNHNKDEWCLFEGRLRELLFLKNIINQGRKIRKGKSKFFRNSI